MIYFTMKLFEIVVFCSMFSIIENDRIEKSRFIQKKSKNKLSSISLITDTYQNFTQCSILLTKKADMICIVEKSAVNTQFI